MAIKTTENMIGLHWTVFPQKTDSIKYAVFSEMGRQLDVIPKTWVSFPTISPTNFVSTSGLIRRRRSQWFEVAFS